MCYDSAKAKDGGSNDAPPVGRCVAFFYFVEHLSEESADPSC